MKQETKKKKRSAMDDHIDHLVDIMESIPLHKVTVLTGRNAQGKSMMRKLLGQFIKKKLDDDRERRSVIAETSLQKRMGNELSFERAWACDCDWSPTSEETLKNLDGVLNVEDRFIVIDELELGMGEELQLGVCTYLEPKIKAAMEKNLGILIITHSRVVAKNIYHDNFINIDGMTEDEWVNRELVPYSPEELRKNSEELFIAFRDRLKPID